MCVQRSIDEDDDMDLADFAVFQRCFTGWSGSWTAPECASADQGDNGNISPQDFCLFLTQWTGPL